MYGSVTQLSVKLHLKQNNTDKLTIQIHKQLILLRGINNRILLVGDFGVFNVNVYYIFQITAELLIILFQISIFPMASQLARSLVLRLQKLYCTSQFEIHMTLFSNGSSFRLCALILQRKFKLSLLGFCADFRVCMPLRAYNNHNIELISIYSDKQKLLFKLYCNSTREQLRFENIYEVLLQI
ncbi:Hypothetical_protein [Hexamita inflata]|uniref:Hypothetical_protein n=1 Tax=Hexamita inflata TaxID=28002 RepID=A0AA86Q5K1_9EUKA|nr:Hypothetical protein HINF_LOCUS33904 [Hexamita inflata]CAI9946262.1 Hypothetical protein HINF_LOCUS33907 [Hexamita inflata]CAI9946264.1 Hypothetical protein HINF_LOCUS33909 [Hexamita inflata]